MRMQGGFFSSTPILPAPFTASLDANDDWPADMRYHPLELLPGDLFRAHTLFRFNQDRPLSKNLCLSGYTRAWEGAYFVMNETTTEPRELKAFTPALVLLVLLAIVNYI